MSGWNEPNLDELFAAYRESLPDREPSANFTPQLWARIEQRREQNLNELFVAYREALPDPEPSANFTPELWRRIDRQRQAVFSFPRFARVFVSGALALCFVMTFLASNVPSSNPTYTATYADVLDEERSHEIDIVGESL